MKTGQNARILRDICPKNTLLSQILVAIPGSKAESERTRPQHQLRDLGRHRSTDAIVYKQPARSANE